MPDAAPNKEKKLSDRQWMQQALHDLSQPLTALECRLYLGTLSLDGEPQPAELAETIRKSSIECERLMARVRSMQDRLREGD